MESLPHPLLSAQVTSKIVQLTKDFVANRKLEPEKSRSSTDPVFDLARKIADFVPDKRDRISIANQLGSLVAIELVTLGARAFEDAKLGDSLDVEVIADRFASRLPIVRPESSSPLLRAFEFASKTKVLREARSTHQLIAGISAFLSKDNGPDSPFFLASKKIAEISGVSTEHIFDVVRIFLNQRLLVMVDEAKPRKKGRTFSFNWDFPDLTDEARRWFEDGIGFAARNTEK